MGDINDIARCLPCGKLRNVSRVYKRRWGRTCPRCGNDAYTAVEPLTWWERYVVIPHYEWFNAKEVARVEASA